MTMARGAAVAETPPPPAPSGSGRGAAGRGDGESARGPGARGGCGGRARARGPAGHLLAVAVAAVGLLGAISGAGAKLLEMSPDAAESVIGRSKKLVLVAMHAPECYHSKQAEPVLEEVAEELAGKVAMIKVDARTSHDFNSKYQVKETPTFMVFSNGTQLTGVREELQGYRTVDSLGPFLEMLVGPDVTEVATPDEVQDMVDAHGFVVCGLFDEPGTKAERDFTELAARRRGHARFASVSGDASTAQSIAEAFEVDAVPTIFVAKRLNHAVQFHGDMNRRAALSAFIDHNSFPLIGNFSLLTYYKYTYRNADKVLLIQDPDTEAEELTNATHTMEEVATNWKDLSFVTVSSAASDGSGATFAAKAGLGAFKTPAVAVLSQDGSQSLALDQTFPVTAARADALLKQWDAMKKGTDHANNCVVKFDGNRDFGSGVLDRYDEHVTAEKARLKIDEDSIREVNEASFKKVLKKAWKDTIILYTSRTCLHSLAMERLLQKVLEAEYVKPLLADELQVVKVDVIMTAPADRYIKQVPTLKYVSARYRDFPNYYTGSPYDEHDVLEFIRTYHSMRHVEIPGEGPSPYSTKRPETTREAIASMDKEEL